MIKRCQDVGFAHRKKAKGEAHVRRAQSPKQMLHFKKQKAKVTSQGKKIGETPKQ